ncbi:MAG: hypothetical protein NWT08_02020 [Akkermansiaceae bacterium]|jgi:hypothetical protein|nr:hypothetical protein [Akkermansiaceae bacterium]MDP4647592.1 hypothetical protein [Akkermansiaceae bacterium]MDP4720751.1 hypothetical protein [Akkermansiaceae bacterium]MDP4781597.1 hypothetical protein [Akkermansiaceae bacterium]MDP4847221.1 hypothetical protein [Akkermansiaceae bacterium]
MNSKQTFKLIEGTYSPSEANHILGALVKSKVKYHNMLLYSHSETNGEGESPSRKRLEDLKDLKKQLDEIYKQAADSNKQLNINGWIEITPVE